MSEGFAKQWLARAGVRIGEGETHESLRDKLVAAAVEKAVAQRGAKVGRGGGLEGLSIDPLDPPRDPQLPFPWRPPQVELPIPWPPQSPWPQHPVPILEVVGGSVCKLGFTGRTLLIQAWGKVTTSGWAVPQLEPVAGFPDANGTMEFAFVAVPPSGIVLQVVTPIFAATLWTPAAPAAIRKIVLRSASNSVELPVDWNAMPTCSFQPFDLGSVIA